MRLSYVFFAATCVLVSSCFLKQDPPQSIQSASYSPSEGLIVLEDISGDQVAAGVIAEFDLTPPSSAVRRLTTHSVDFPQVGIHSLVQNRDAQCQMIAASHDLSVEDQTPALISAGTMTFGPASASAAVLSTVNEQSDNSYLLSLSPGVPSGSYQIQVTGSTQIPAFGVTLSLPEVLANVTIANATLDTHSLQLKKAEALNVTWNGPIIANDSNLMVLDIYATTASGTTQMHCVTPETSQLVNKTGTWNIPASYMSQLPVTNTAQIYLARAYVLDGTQNSITVEAQGLRSVLANASLE